jgi:uncharacterized protein involved in response to NO
MSERPEIGPNLTVEALLAAYPEVRPALQARGIDTCCGGVHTLLEVAGIKGYFLKELLASLRQAATGSITGADTVRQVLARHPQTVMVFEKFGLMGCGGSAGPDERIDLFASIHRLDAAALLRELQDAVDHPPAVPNPGAVKEAPPLYPAFLKAALLCTLTLGATFGAWNLLMIHRSILANPPSHNWVHAGFQIWGFVFLFLVGVSLHTFPRFLGTELRHPRWARSTLWLTLGGQVLISWGRLGDLLPATLPSLTIGILLQAAAVVLWAGVLFATWRRADSPRDLVLAFLGAGTLSWLAAAGFFLYGALQALLETDTDAAVKWNQPVYALALYGGTLAWIQGMFLRTGTMFLSLKPTRLGLVKAALFLGQAGAWTAAIGGARVGRPGALALMDAGLLGVAASVVVYAAGMRPFSRGLQHVMPGGGSFATVVRLAFAGSLLFAALGGYYGTADLAGWPANGLIHDGARHAFTLGFVTLIIFGFASRVVPIFGGTDLRHPRLLAAGSWLIVAGVILREAQVGVALLNMPALTWISGPSGFVAATGVFLCSLAIWSTLNARPVAATRTRVTIDEDANVGALVDAHEEAIPILVEAGFTPIANPLLRKTLARAVTLRQACSIHKIDVDQLLKRLRETCTPRT